jgi:hypothetical protein
MSLFIDNEIVKLREAKKDRKNELEECTQDYNDMVNMLTNYDMKDRFNAIVVKAIKVWNLAESCSRVCGCSKSERDTSVNK